ncbi:hypothetical protein ABVT39_021868 [Epinephelus coioides]
MSMRSQASRVTHLTPHEMLTSRLMPLPYLRGPHEGPSLEQLQGEMFDYLRSLTHIHRAISQQVKGTTEDRRVEIPEDLQRILPGEWVYVKVFKRKWDQPRREELTTQRGCRQRAPQRKTPHPQWQTMDLMSRHLVATGLMMRAQAQGEQREEREQRQKESREKKAAAQKQIGAEHGQHVEIPVSKAAESRVGLPRPPSHVRGPAPI